MAKKKKNANYVTEKTVAAKEKKQEEKLKAEKAKKIKIASIVSASVAAFVGLIMLILALSGAFDYHPKVTHHASVTLSDGTSFHIELYGDDAHESVESFVALCNKGYFNGKSILSLTGSVLYMGDENADGGTNGIKGEFAGNGVENNIPMKKGTLIMARGEGNNSAYGQFGILSKKLPALEGNYAAFGRLSDPSVLKDIIKSCTFDADGNVITAPTIQSISIHSDADHAH